MSTPMMRCETIASATELGAQLKKVQDPIMRAIGNPLLPAAVRVGLGELNTLLVMMAYRIEQLEKKGGNDGD